jgi:hypothetical protein
MLKSFKESTHRVGVVGHIQIGMMQKTQGGYEMGASVDYFRITTNQKIPNSVSFEVDQRAMIAISGMVKAGKLPAGATVDGTTTKLPIFAAYDRPDSNCVIDRALYVGPQMFCHSDDEETAEWRMNKDRDTGQFMWPGFPDVLKEQHVENLGDVQRVRCGGPRCPLVVTPLQRPGRKGMDTFLCKPRHTFLFRLRVDGLPGNGVVDFDSTSTFTAGAIYAALVDLERLVGQTSAPCRSRCT